MKPFKRKFEEAKPARRMAAPQVSKGDTVVVINTMYRPQKVVVDSDSYKKGVLDLIKWTDQKGELHGGVWTGNNWEEQGSWTKEFKTLF